MTGPGQEMGTPGAIEVTLDIKQQVDDDGVVEIAIRREKVRGALDYIDEMRDNLPNGIISSMASSMMLLLLEERAEQLLIALDCWLPTIQTEPLR